MMPRDRIGHHGVEGGRQCGHGMLSTRCTVIDPSPSLTRMGIAGNLPDVVLKCIGELAEIVPSPTKTCQRTQLRKVAKNTVAKTPSTPGYPLYVAVAPQEGFPS